MLASQIDIFKISNKQCVNFISTVSLNWKKKCQALHKREMPPYSDNYTDEEKQKIMNYELP